MTKRFCDLCGAEAVDLPHQWHERTLGEPYHGYYDGAERVRQCRIVVRISFGLVEHPHDFGGPPDLCMACAAKLVGQAAARGR